MGSTGPHTGVKHVEDPSCCYSGTNPGQLQSPCLTPSSYQGSSSSGNFLPPVTPFSPANVFNTSSEVGVRQLNVTSQGTIRVSYHAVMTQRQHSCSPSEQLEHAHLNCSTTGVTFLVLLHHRGTASPREMRKLSAVIPRLPGMDTVPWVVKRVAHYVCV